MYFFIEEPKANDYLAGKKSPVKKKTSLQSKNGKAFEFATLLALYQQLPGQEITVKQTTMLKTVEEAYAAIDEELKSSMNKAAIAAVKVLLKLEPQLVNPLGNSPLYLAVQKDAAGIVGDVRDILTIRMQNDWEIGLSCKHNHSAVKHSRLSKNLDFGAKWFGSPCSAEYFAAIAPLFDKLYALQTTGELWKNVALKEEQYYVPLLQAFMNELNRLYLEYRELIPEKLLQYLLGKHDFYKVITSDKDELTTIQAFNIHGTLNRNAGSVQPQQKIPRLALPGKIFNIDFKEGLRNTIQIVCSDGWTINMRIHSASTKVEPSLKFDVSLEGHPAKLYSQREPW